MRFASLVIALAIGCIAASLIGQEVVCKDGNCSIQSRVRIVPAKSLAVESVQSSDCTCDDCQCGAVQSQPVQQVRAFRPVRNTLANRPVRSFLKRAFCR